MKTLISRVARPLCLVAALAALGGCYYAPPPAPVAYGYGPGYVVGPSVSVGVGGGYWGGRGYWNGRGYYR